MKALILAAGYATRLYPLTKEYPKPLLTVNGRPIIDFIIDKLQDLCEVEEIIVVTNSKFISKFKQWKKKLGFKKKISLVDDLTKDNLTRRGAIGDMHFAINKKRIKDDLLVIGGDNLFDTDLKGFLDFAKKKEKSPTVGIYNIKSKLKAGKYGVVRLDKRNRIVGFWEKPKSPRTTFVAMCLYYFPSQKLNLIREYVNNKKLKKDATGLYIDWLKNKTSVYGFLFSGRWYDIGDVKFYSEARHQKFVH